MLATGAGDTVGQDPAQDGKVDGLVAVIEQARVDPSLPEQGLRILIQVPQEAREMHQWTDAHLAVTHRRHPRTCLRGGNRPVQGVPPRSPLLC